MSIYNERYLSFPLEDVRSIFSPFAGYINDVLKQKYQRFGEIYQISTKNWLSLRIRENLFYINTLIYNYKILHRRFISSIFYFF